MSYVPNPIFLATIFQIIVHLRSEDIPDKSKECFYGDNKFQPQIWISNILPILEWICEFRTIQLVKKIWERKLGIQELW